MPQNAHGQPIGVPVDTDRFPLPAPPRSPMSGRLCTVAPFDAAHIPALYAAFAKDAPGTNWTYLPYGPFDTEAAFRIWAGATCKGDDPLFHTVLDATGTPVGLASYLRIDRGAGAIEVGHIHLSPLLQRTAAATEAMFLMTSRVFDMGYRRYEWKCDALNAPSRAAAARLGFTYEGTFRQATHYKGRNRDTAWFAMIDTDWPRIRAAFEAWLAPENFDTDGRQKTRLAARD